MAGDDGELDLVFAVEDDEVGAQAWVEVAAVGQAELARRGVGTSLFARS